MTAAGPPIARHRPGLYTLGLRTHKAALMLERSAQREHDVSKSRAPADFQEHLANLEAAGLLVRVDREVNKDTELHPLVRWQFQGGLDEDQRRAFLFTNVVGDRKSVV